MACSRFDSAEDGHELGVHDPTEKVPSITDNQKRGLKGVPFNFCKSIHEANGLLSYVWKYTLIDAPAIAKGILTQSQPARTTQGYIKNNEINSQKYNFTSFTCGVKFNYITVIKSNLPLLSPVIFPKAAWEEIGLGGGGLHLLCSTGYPPLSRLSHTLVRRL